MSIRPAALSATVPVFLAALVRQILLGRDKFTVMKWQFASRNSCLHNK